MPDYSKTVEFVTVEEYRTLRNIADSLIRSIVNGEQNARELAIEYAGVIDTVFGPDVDEDVWVDGIQSEVNEPEMAF